MCGIFGVSVTESAGWPPRDIERAFRELLLLSESRGKEAAGVAALNNGRIEVYKSALAASDMLRTRAYAEILDRSLRNGAVNGRRVSHSVTLIGHSRLVTTGSQFSPDNNQPVIAGRAVGIHNGIVVNHEELWTRFPRLTRRSQVDTEVVLVLMRMFCDDGQPLEEAVRATFRLIKGATSIAVLFEDFDALLLATNNGSLYRCSNPANDMFCFASEKYILEQLAKRPFARKHLRTFHEIRHIAPGQACLVNVRDLSIYEFPLGNNQGPSNVVPRASKTREIILIDADREERRLSSAQRTVGLKGPLDEETARLVERLRMRFPHETCWQDSLRRCTKCVLPETMPFIEFDADGVCNYCRNYRPLRFKGVDTLQEIAAKYRTSSTEPDCVVGVSGGRDSLYTLHFVKTVLKLNPVAYTYDWGMVTDLARRNISRICGKLGIEHILVSADITWKRNNIRSNVSAWLRKPHLGMIPLFMAGDKQYFYYLQRVRRQLGVKLAILGENMLERTDFKTGFAGVPPYNVDPDHVYTLPLSSKAKLFAYYGKQYLTNWGYLNASLWDTAFAAACYYLIDRNYLNLYTYVPWIEDEIVSTLINEYEFELAPDSTTTWRIGDGTSAFYNYIYFNVAGFTENETFRSHQIREGLITREEALKRVREENKPRYETIVWYLSIIGLEDAIERVFETIHRVPRLRAS